MFIVVLPLTALWYKPLKFPSTVEWIQNWDMFIHINSYIFIPDASLFLSPICEPFFISFFQSFFMALPLK